eukprot:4475930-Amphidinium_carterae.1
MGKGTVGDLHVACALTTSSSTVGDLQLRVSEILSLPPALVRVYCPFLRYGLADEELPRHALVTRWPVLKIDTSPHSADVLWNKTSLTSSTSLRVG